LKPTLTILAIAASASLLSSCALILGFDDHEPYPADSTMGGGGGSSTTGSGGGGGAGTTSSSSGTGGMVPPPQFGAPEVIASGPAGPSDITLDGTTVYWVNVGLATGQAQIAKVPKSGGVPAQIVENQMTLRGLEVTPTNVWCAEWWSDASGTRSYIVTAGKAANTASPPILYKVDYATYFTIALQGTTIAWSSDETMGSIFRGDTLGNAKTTVATKQGQVGRIALDGNVTYWVSPQQSAVMRENGGTVEVFAAGQSNPTDIALDADSVYWTCNDGSVKRLAKTSPGGQPTVIAGDALAPQGIALDATNVYWAENDVGGRVRTAPKGGGKVDTIATGQNPFDIAADASAVYVTMQGDGNIVRIPKQ
jgi:hypothetical protein